MIAIGKSLRAHGFVEIPMVYDPLVAALAEIIGDSAGMRFVVSRPEEPSQR